MAPPHDSASLADWIRRLQREGTILMRCDDAADPWRLYETPRQIFITHDPAEVMPLLADIEAAVDAGEQACGYLAYEAAGAMDEAMEVCVPSAAGSDHGPLPLLWFGIYDKAEKFKTLPELEGADCYVGPWAANRTSEEYGCDFARIKDYIAAGDTYQINYTIRLDAAFHGSPYALFYRLYRRQPTTMATFMNLGSHAICSVTPELFFERRGSCVISKPMKGTRPADRDSARHSAQRAELAVSEKDRAENAMIVDMIRND
ncbi:MAG: chorismate-binding protein, partial [Planctomycetia bacterium]